MKTHKRFIVLLGLVVLVGCAQQPLMEAPAPPDTRDADAASIHALVEEWSAAAQAKDPVGFASVYAENSRLMLESAPDVNGRQAIQEALGGMMQDPNFDLSFEADEVVVSRSSDLAYETGTYSMTLSDPEGNPATQMGYYVVVWQKQADGSWKVVVDAPVSDPPEVPATE